MIELLVQEDFTLQSVSSFFKVWSEEFSRYSSQNTQPGAAARLEKLEGDATTSGHSENCIAASVEALSCCVTVSLGVWLTGLDLHDSYSHSF